MYMSCIFCIEHEMEYSKSKMNIAYALREMKIILSRHLLQAPASGCCTCCCSQSAVPIASSYEPVGAFFLFLELFLSTVLFIKKKRKVLYLAAVSVRGHSAIPVFGVEKPLCFSRTGAAPMTAREVAITKIANKMTL